MQTHPPPLRNRGRPCPATALQSCLNPAVSLSLVPFSPIPSSRRIRRVRPHTIRQDSHLRRLRLLPFLPLSSLLTRCTRRARQETVRQELFRSLRLSFFFCLFFVFHRVLPPIFLCLFRSFPESEISEDRLSSVFVRVVSPVKRVSGKTPKNLRLHRWLAPFLPAAFAASPFVATEPPASAGFLALFLFLFARASARAFPFPFSPGCECHLTHWSPELEQRVVPPFCGGSIPLQYLRDGLCYSIASGFLF